MTHRATKHFLILIALATGFTLTAQAQSVGDGTTGSSKNYISTGAPILMNAPDAVSGALGDAGVASTPDANSSHWNNAKFVFADKNFGLTTTYTPWLHNLGVNDLTYLYLGGYYKLGNLSALAASLTYFSMGEITHTGETGENLGEFYPNEFAIDITYSMKLSNNLSLGATGRYIRSDLTNGMDVGTSTTKAGTALSADVGMYYQSDWQRGQQYAFGVHVSNLGNKLSYSDDDNENEFLPANLRLGGRYSYEVNEYNKLNFLLDFNKLLVPTPPTADAENGNRYYENIAEYRNTGSIAGVFSSFMDAPGGFVEELKEISAGLGVEYWYASTFALRAGYFYEHHDKGDRRYLTLGAGIRYNMLALDLSYLVPTSQFSQNPLANTIRISLSVNV